MTYLLAADVGGTKTRLALFEKKGGAMEAVQEEELPSRDFASMEDLLRAYLAGRKAEVTSASFGVAGPVRDNRVRLTNLSWELDGAELASTFGFERVHLVNDLAAIASSIPHLEPADLTALHEGTPVEDGNIGVLAPGTGLGVSFLVWDGERHVSCPSEGGHVSFSPGNEEEVKLLHHYLKQGRHVSFEFLCSGIGLPHIYRFLKEEGRYREPLWLARELDKARDKNPVIIRAALDREDDCPICRAAMRLFTDILAEACGNLAVTVMARGGIYIGGGIPPRILPLLREESFLHRLQARGRMSAMVADIPVSVIMNSRAALIGAAAYGFDQEQQV